MKVIRALNNLDKIPKGTVATIGIFDGIHRGHLAVFYKVINEAKIKKVPSLAITFHPHPSRITKKNTALPLLISLEHRLLMMRNLGINYCLVIPFDRNFSLLFPHLFVKNILCAGLGIKILYVGNNFRFGYGQEGGIRLLKRLSKEFHFRLTVVRPVKYRKRIISSSWIRKELNLGNLDLVSRLLGRPFSIYGKVVKGEGRGKRLGFPTANLDIKHEALPPSGVYLVKVYFKKDIYPGLLYIGHRPTFSKVSELSVEVYLLDFKNNLYGKFLEVEFIKRVRAERQFDKISSLVLAMKEDESFARSFFSQHSSQ
ncbi:MAG: bifunctional riboflavin kinase/FAD synthetase [Candidatus Omnitrophica bacterium]|nr:bifunctional riboflavin kinase/FAD synthetase [Candidatus Omnitrophota bacterium]